MVLGASCGLQIALVSSLFAGDYYLTYSLATKQLVISGEKTYLSRAMVSFDNHKVLYKTSIENTNPVSQNEKQFVKDHLNDIVMQIMQYKVKVTSMQKNIDVYGLSEETSVKVAPIPIVIEFNDDFVTISVVQE
jgi:malonyl CoA-acyl carrier protein transacylase